MLQSQLDVYYGNYHIAAVEIDFYEIRTPKQRGREAEAERQCDR